MRRKGLIRFLVACLPWLVLPVLAYLDLSLWGAAAGLAIVLATVSYTHLTLPTN